MSTTYRNRGKYRWAAAAITCAAFLTYVPAARGQSTDPVRRVVPVHIDVTTGDITVGSTVYPGKSPGMHLLALKRQPNQSHPDTPDLIQDATFLDATAANQFLANVLSTNPDAFLILNGVGNYGFNLSALATNLTNYGGNTDIPQINAPAPMVFIGSGGRNPGQALQRGYGTLNIDGSLAADSNGNYAYIQLDFVRYDITTDGNITVGSTTYTAQASYRNPGCSGMNAFRLVVVDRETPDRMIANNSYCTAAVPTDFGAFSTDLNGVVGNEGVLAFIGVNGHPIPADWNFGTDGDGRIYTLATKIAQLGGYFQTIVYLTPTDTYSLVGAAPPPAGTPGARQRTKESSSVYPDHPSGELHGMLARQLRGHWYNPLNADTSGIANLGFYEILAQPPVPFPHPVTPDEVTAFQAISQHLTHGAATNVRNRYGDTNIDIDSYTIALTVMRTPDNKDCDDSTNANLPFCIVRQQLLTELQYIGDIRDFYGNLNALWTASGTETIFSLLSAYNDVQGTIQAPAQAPASTLVNPIVNLFLGLAGFIPEVGPLFGLADTAFNFATSLTTDSSGNAVTSLTTTVGQLQDQAAQHFAAQGNTVGTQFDVIYQDWGKISALGMALESAAPEWSWEPSTTAQIISSLRPVIEESFYQTLMPAAYAIGRYYPFCYLCGGRVNWGGTPIWEQASSYSAWGGPHSPGGTAKEFPFSWPTYAPYTFPTDQTNPIQLPSNPAYTEGTPTILADNAWLGISLQSTPAYNNGTGVFDPPGGSTLAHLFTPRSKGGLGVYRPAFFVGWPFPQVTCDTSDNGSGDPGGGCPWSSGSPSPDTLAAPRTDISIRVGKVRKNGSQLDVTLLVVNSGTVPLRQLEIQKISVRRLAGTGDASLITPGLPAPLTDFPPAATATINIQVNVPPGVVKLMIGEEGVVSSDTAEPKRFSQSQVLYPASVQ